MFSLKKINYDKISPISIYFQDIFYKISNLLTPQKSNDFIPEEYDIDLPVLPFINGNTKY